MEGKKTNLLDFLQQDGEIGKVRDKVLATGEAVVYGLYEGQRMLVQRLWHSSKRAICW